MRRFRQSAMGTWFVGVLAATLVGSASGQMLAPTPKSTEGVTAGQVIGLVTDVFAGRGVVGPYLLTWKEIDAGGEHVMRGARALRRGDDYVIDPAAGMLTFAEPLGPGESARAVYTVTPGRARENKPPAASGLQLNLLQSGGGFVLSALVRPQAGATAQAGPERVLLALAGETGKEATGQLTSRLFLDSSGGNVLERGGILLREKRTGGPLEATVSYARAGAGFVGGPETGVTVGREVMEASGAWRAPRGFVAQAAFSRTTDLTAAGGGATLTTYTEQLASAANAPTRFQASHTTAVAEKPGADSAATNTTRLQIDQRLGSLATATATLDRQEVATGTASSVTQTTAVTMAAQPTPRVSIQGSVATRMTPQGVEDGATVQLKARVTSRIALTAGTDDRYGLASWLHARSMATEYTPSAAVRLTGGVEQRAEPGREALIGVVSGEARLARWSEITGAVRMRDVSVNGHRDPLSLDTYKAGVALTLGRGAARITGGYIRNPEDASGAPKHGESGTVGVASKLGAFEVTGSYSVLTEDTAPRDTEQFGVGLGWAIARATRLDTRYLASFTRDSSLLATDTYSLNLTHSVASRLDLVLSGSLTTQQQNGVTLPNRDYRIDARLGVRF